jgi:hypothetical protein
MMHVVLELTNLFNRYQWSNLTKNTSVVYLRTKGVVYYTYYGAASSAICY